MTAANPLVESEAAKQAAQPVERNVAIRSAAQDLDEKNVALGHGRSLAERPGKAERSRSAAAGRREPALLRTGRLCPPSVCSVLFGPAQRSAVVPEFFV